MENGKIFQQLIPGIVEIYGDLLVSVILYGSVARSTQTSESDIDIAVMLRSKENDDMKERMTDIIVDLELEHNKVLSVLRIDYEKFNSYNKIIIHTTDGVKLDIENPNKDIEEKINICFATNNKFKTEDSNKPAEQQRFKTGTIKIYYDLENKCRTIYTDNA